MTIAAPGALRRVANPEASILHQHCQRDLSSDLPDVQPLQSLPQV